MSDEDKQAAFARRMAAILNDGALNLGCSIGYSLGLFEAMDRLQEPADAARVASEAGLDERYVYEWLCAMAAGGIVESCPSAEDAPGLGRDERFLLPPEHAAVLTRRSGSANLGVYTQEMPLLTHCAMEQVQAAFATGQGVDYSHYPRFQQFMGQLAQAKQRSELLQSFLPAIEDGALASRLEHGIDVLDVGCAEGEAVLLMAGAFPRSRFTGMDIDPEALETARRKVGEAGIENASFVLQDVPAAANSKHWQARFDYITAFDAIHDQTRPLEALQAIHALLRPMGRFSMVDIAAESSLHGNLEHPMATFLYMVSLMHCMPVGLVDGGAGLGMMWGRQRALAMLQQAGFQNATVEPVPNDSFNLHFYCSKGG